MFLRSGSKLVVVKRILIYLSVFTVLYIFLFLPIDMYEDPDEYTVVDWNYERLKQEEEWDKAYFVNTEGCRMPSLPVHSPIIDEFVYQPDTFTCKKAITEANDQYLWIALNKTELNDYYNVTDVEFLICKSTPFHRIDDYYNKYEYENSTYFRYGDVLKVDREYVYVSCDYGTVENMYEDYHFFYPKQTKQEERRTSPINVMILGIDSVSRLNFHRRMPKSVEVLLEKFKAIEMFGYNKLEDNTFPNLMPLLTGLDVTELAATCIPFDNSTFDSCTFIWERYKAKGYTTAFADDTGSLGLFNYFRGGFTNQPTDFNTRPIIKVLESLNDTLKHGNTYVCVGPHRTIEFLLSYARKFVNYIKSSPYWSFFWTSTYSHDYLNDANLIDDDFSQHLDHLWSSNTLENTILFVMSDHGLRYGDFRRTYQGMMEERQPFLYVIPPKWFYDEYPLAVRNLFRNRRKLTTHFDLHETLKDLADLYTVSNWHIEERTKILAESAPLPRGISLFLPIPDHRTCESAGITEHWCTCHERIDVPTDDSRAKMAARLILQQINTMIKPFPHCRSVVLSSITDAYLTSPSSYNETATKTERDFSDITIRLLALPGLNEFESTVRIYADNTLERVGLISRTSLYAAQSHCIEDHKIKLYCYCDDLPLKT